MAELIDVYLDERSRLAALVAELPDAQLAASVPATPGWSVRDVIAHLAGDVSGLLTGDFPSASIGTFGNAAAIDDINAWTDRMVETRRALPVSELLAAWQADADRLGAQVAAGIPLTSAPPFPEVVLITDLTVHAHDINGALGRRDDRDGTGVRIAISGYLGALPWWQPQLPSLHIVTEAKTYTVGTGDAPTTLRIERFELFRALSGRRSADQLRAYEWDGNPEPYLGAFAPYGSRADALVE